MTLKIHSLFEFMATALLNFVKNSVFVEYGEHTYNHIDIEDQWYFNFEKCSVRTFNLKFLTEACIIIWPSKLYLLGLSFKLNFYLLCCNTSMGRTPNFDVLFDLEINVCCEIKCNVSTYSLHILSLIPFLFTNNLPTINYLLFNKDKLLLTIIWREILFYF